MTEPSATSDEARDHNPPSWPASLFGVVKAGAVGLLFAAVAFFLEEKVNPFGLSEAISASGAIVLQRATAPVRDLVNPGRANIGRDAVTVVLLDSDFMEALRESDPNAGLTGRPAGGADQDPAQVEPRLRQCLRDIEHGNAPQATDPIGWPLPAAVIAHCVVGRVAKARPAAVFLDLILGDTARQKFPGGSYARGGADLGQALVDEHALDRTPLLLADSPSVSGSSFNSDGDGFECMSSSDLTDGSLVAPLLREEVKKASAPGQIEFVNAAHHGYSDIYPLLPQMLLEPRQTCDLTGIHWDHDIAWKDGAPLRYLPSPALRLFEIYTTAHQGDQRVGADIKARWQELMQPMSMFQTSVDNGFTTVTVPEKHQDWITDPGTGVLMPMWSAHPSARVVQSSPMLEAQGDGCKSAPGDGILASSWAALTTFWSNFRGSERGEAPDCVYIDTISATRLFTPEAWGHGPEGTTADDLLRGRVVMIGANLPQVNDRLETPAGQDVPGVYTHAVAFENLLGYGGDFHSRKNGLPALFTVILAFAVVPALSRLGAVPLLSIAVGILNGQIAPPGSWRQLMGALRAARKHGHGHATGHGHTPGHSHAQRDSLHTGHLIPIFLWCGVVLFLLLTAQAAAGVALLLFTSIPAQKAVLPLFFAYVPVWHAAVDELGDIAKDVIMLPCRSLVRLARAGRSCIQPSRAQSAHAAEVHAAPPCPAGPGEPAEPFMLGTGATARTEAGLTVSEVSHAGPERGAPIAFG